jgi:hypothetical protein
MSKIKVELQHFIGCPNSPILIDRVKSIIKNYNNIEYIEILVDSNERAVEVKFRGSPTLLINGKDFENLPEPESPALTCRYYLNGLPTVEGIKVKIESLI